MQTPQHGAQSVKHRAQQRAHRGSEEEEQDPPHKTQTTSLFVFGVICFKENLCVLYILFSFKSFLLLGPVHIMLMLVRVLNWS